MCDVWNDHRGLDAASALSDRRRERPRFCDVMRGMTTAASTRTLLFGIGRRREGCGRRGRDGDLDRDEDKDKALLIG